MADTLEIFGHEFQNVTGIIATNDSDTDLTYIRPQGTKSITANGNNIDVAAYATANVAVPSSSPTIDSLTVTPTTSQQVFNSSSVDGYKPVTVNAMPSGTEGTPVITKGTVSSRGEMIIEASVTNTTGYITGGTLVADPVVIDRSEFVSGKTTITENGTDIYIAAYETADVNVPTGTARGSSDLTVSGATVTVPAGLYSQAASKSVASGSVTAPSSITGTSATVSTGTNTLTLTKTVSVTPNVTAAGYVNEGTAGNASVSLTASVTTQAAQTIYPSTTDQTIASGRYLTGAQTIKAVTTSNLTAANIANGVTVTVGDSADPDRIASVTGTYSGGGGSSMNCQAAQSTTRATSTSYTEVISLICDTTGTYDVYWSTFRSSTSGTWGSQLYINDSSYGSEQTGSWSNHIQNIHLTGVQIDANEEVAVRVRSRGSSYYGYVGTLTIIQTS